MRKGLTSEKATINEILDKSPVLWLAVNDANGPYSVPVNFAHEGDVIYVHSSTKGRKFEALETGAPLSFSCAVDLEPKHGDKACAFGYRFKSALGFGAPRRLSGDDARHALEVITRKFAGRNLPLEDKVVAVTAAYAIDITSITARIKE
ncbi:pyridoxamine 5'-phosphate oxidase family protein [Salidesulfovibrio onnuriiensis]|uniref:pyridoxamine 5'-phosphate oxidase family protein n=1 Tax=Salidesulfovibrio onnuriiensis TaxID=2583823 RepID=UPI0011C7BB28|nr:pyridoxamine 5'-phosphate oxidase family protein [Salidesulfovibrio onnuriiensis]